MTRSTTPRPTCPDCNVPLVPQPGERAVAEEAGDSLACPECGREVL